MQDPAGRRPWRNPLVCATTGRPVQRATGSIGAKGDTSGAHGGRGYDPLQVSLQEPKLS
jgi:hypothetical protein